jgi:hypothetical protein
MTTMATTMANAAKTVRQRFPSAVLLGEVMCFAGNLRLDVSPRSAAIFVPDDMRLRNYKFFKPRNLA